MIQTLAKCARISSICIIKNVDEGDAWVENFPKETEKMIVIILYCGLENVTAFAPEQEHIDAVP